MKTFTRGDAAGYPKTCVHCGQPIHITGQRSIQFHHDHYTGTTRAWHTDCANPPGAVPTSVEPEEV